MGVPLWTTELDVINPDENIRADWYEKALRALYGHPAIEGILFWGFWGDIQSGGQDAALVTGPNLAVSDLTGVVLTFLKTVSSFFPDCVCVFVCVLFVYLLRPDI